MTVLLVDVGNTRIKWAALAAAVLGPRGAAVHDRCWAADKIGPVFDAVPRPSRALVASVAGADSEDAIARLVTERWGCAVDFVRSTRAACGVTNGYERPEQLGVDRWLALIAAHADHAGATCVADCGTAVTVDIIDAAGHHRGGVILPGIRAMGQCVLAHTRIPACSVEETGRPFGRRTGEALGAGGFSAVAGAVARSLDAARELLGTAPRLLLAGGDAARVAAGLGVPSELRPDLVIEGLAALAKETEA